MIDLIIIGVIVSLIVAIIYYLRKRKKDGKTTCGSCNGCKVRSCSGNIEK